MRVLFLGEGDLSGPARYLAAVLTWAKIPFDHQPDQSNIPEAWCRKIFDAVILSDYRYSSWTPRSREWLIETVTVQGTGLLMIGGWASYAGLVGGYGGTSIEKLLPVTCVRGDDRVQKASGALLLPSKGRLFQSPPPVICGYHRAMPKPGTQVPYVFRDLTFKRGRLSLGPIRPALVLGRAGPARTAAFLTDCAPHWAGGLVDWGSRRVVVQIRGQGSVEVGELYLKTFRDLIWWCAGKRGTR